MAAEEGASISDLKGQEFDYRQAFYMWSQRGYVGLFIGLGMLLVSTIPHEPWVLEWTLRYSVFGVLAVVEWFLYQAFSALRKSFKIRREWRAQQKNAAQ